jgi:hypothetical protein
MYTIPAFDGYDSTCASSSITYSAALSTNATMPICITLTYSSSPSLTFYSTTDDNCAGSYIIYVTATLDNTASSKYYELDLTIYSLCRTAEITPLSIATILVGYPGT